MGDAALHSMGCACKGPTVADKHASATGHCPGAFAEVGGLMVVQPCLSGAVSTWDIQGINVDSSGTSDVCDTSVSALLYFSLANK